MTSSDWQPFKAKANTIFCIAVAAFIGTGCSDSSQSNPASDSFSNETVEQRITQRIDRILLRSSDETVSESIALDDGTTLEHFVRKPTLLDDEPGRWTPPTEMFARTPGVELDRFPKEQIPNAFVVDNEGTVILSNGDGVKILKPDGSQSMLSSHQASVLQWNPDGSQLLVAGPEEKQILSWPGATVTYNLNQSDLQGLLQFSPSGDALWLLREQLSFDASDVVRIKWDVDRVPFETLKPEPLVAGKVLADIRTLPSLGIVWGHNISDHKILPDPAPLLRLDNEFHVDSYLTRKDDWVDFSPSASGKGRLYFLRAPRRVDGFVMRTTRAWTALDDDAYSARAITAEPTYNVAASPDGERLAFVFLREGDGVVITTTPDRLLHEDTTAATLQQAVFAKNARDIAHDVRSAFEEETASEAFDNTKPWPEISLLQTMDNALRDSMQRRLKITLPHDFSTLGIIDDYLAEADGLWDEEPAMIVAIAGLYGNVLIQKPGVQWLLSTSSGELSQDLQDVSASDDMLYTFHGVFYIARERLAGRLRLDDTAHEVLTRWERPIILVENYRQPTIDAFLISELERAGISGDVDFNTENFAHIVTHAPDNDIANQMAMAFGANNNAEGIAFLAALNLAESNAYNPMALIRAARVVQQSPAHERALELYRRAEQIAPEDPNVKYECAVGYLDAMQLNEAESRFRRVLELDAINEFDDVIKLQLDLIAELRQPEPKQ